ncbi:hypothetical protein FOZ61_006475 [Perkinsus olseni]|uniref:RRM domain-containing protein n=1 Tax=Perkinsus olseni TaxID=32597 RepID=A0A7J6RP49_PEROL|nr:hypothetical protein FOZ61_006475 [Perkinsus olseni]KAF4673843.1 hypothetical protein FOL46_006396 [Perkinsus olseni]KAF4715173.1 hypothetical protein FOZ62_029780 [Perkinsus olseni]KAF4722347.1 hypothetical protein FOZ63_027945 [Perkinsus olseni]
MILRRSRGLLAELVGDHIHPFRVNVTGLHYGTTVADVRALFRDYKSIPQVGGVQLAAPTSRDKGTPFFTGRAWVTFENPEEAVHASEAMNGRFVHSVDGGWRRVAVFCNFSGPKIVREEKWPPVPDEYRLRKVTALKAVGGRKFNHFPIMTLNEQKHRRRWKIGNWPRAHKA